MTKTYGGPKDQSTTTVRKHTFFSAAKLRDLPCWDDMEDQETDDCMWVLVLLLQWLEKIWPTACHKQQARKG